MRPSWESMQICARGGAAEAAALEEHAYGRPEQPALSERAVLEERADARHERRSQRRPPVSGATEEREATQKSLPENFMSGAKR